MYCNGIVALTPLKTNIMDVSSESKLQAESSIVVSKEIDFSEDVHAATEEFRQRPIPKILSPLKSPTWPSCNVRDLARRHSLSLLDRTPPRNSLAEELLNFDKLRANTSNLMTNIKGITESLSDFNSCLSITDESDDECSTSQKNKISTKKRKKSPEKLENVKKPNVKNSAEKGLKTQK